MGRRAAQRPVNRLTVSVRLTRREILYRDTYGTSMCARVTHAIVLKRRNVRRDARRGRAWRGDARTHARVRECVRACVGACNARERCARRLFRYCCYCWGNNRPSIGCPGTMYLFRCGQGCSIDRPPFAKKHRERIVLNSPVQWWIRWEFPSSNILANNFDKEIRRAFLEYSGGERGWWKSADRRSLLLLLLLLASILIKGKTRLANGTNGPVNDGTRWRQPR